MKLRYTSHFIKRLNKKVKQKPELKKQIGLKLEQLIENPRQSSLKLHKLKGARAQEYAIWIEQNLRVTFQIKGDLILLSDIITHDEY